MTKCEINQQLGNKKQIVGSLCDVGGNLKRVGHSHCSVSGSQHDTGRDFEF